MGAGLMFTHQPRGYRKQQPPEIDPPAQQPAAAPKRRRRPVWAVLRFVLLSVAVLCGAVSAGLVYVCCPARRPALREIASRQLVQRAIDRGLI
jgi:hypothetical protein